MCLRFHRGVLKKTVVVAATSSESAALRFLAPYAGCAIGEYFMQEGKHALVVYDDLTKHAWAYREISLLLRRPTGREAYPGDVFYLHSRLLERACQLSDENGGGSLTALPIIETQAQDVSAYIPTNVISITDGQIYLEPDLFFAGIRPALNVGLSVSRIGGAAQIKLMKKIAGRMRLDLSQYYELATFAQFATDLDSATKEKIERGKRIVEVLKQRQFSPMKVEDEIVVIFLAVSGSLDDIPIPLVTEFENGFLSYFNSNYTSLQKDLAEKGDFNEKLETKLTGVISKFKKEFIRTHQLEREEDGGSQIN
ncbi:MAG: ATP synthase subunit alpha [Candidatus Woesebacteria bacterium GW2011_GWA1_39_12]|uniref:ATP synthase subunit alpha n=1 Tax=Candidatus Woesebacteria bacterium GW2011_GWA1_39_12 TaxID=1618549 RepID=A0A0G0LZY1_9BACT|nr:MAG: ATP synthase subunit alpha [Candidatus Woesebacteria bacterium GW2011_GWA1_39_12]